MGEDSNKEFKIKGLKEYVATSIEECFELLKQGEINRHYAATAMNHTSSRSHTIFRVKVQIVKEMQDSSADISTITESVLNFVDLAGSEKVSNH